MPYLLKFYIVVDESEDDIAIENSIEEAINSVLSNDSRLELVGTTTSDLDKSICGKCCKCGAWVSDQENKRCVEGFSDGSRINREWWCDICIDSNHPKRF